MLCCSGRCACSSPSSTGARAKLESSRAATTPGVKIKQGILMRFSRRMVAAMKNQWVPAVSFSVQVTIHCQRNIRWKRVRSLKALSVSWLSLGCVQKRLRYDIMTGWVHKSIQKLNFKQYNCAIHVCKITVFLTFIFFFLKKGNWPKVLDISMHSEGKGCSWRNKKVI